MSFNEKEVRAGYAALTRLLIEKGLTISTMESATSGQIASLVTDTEGSSAVLKGAFVTYCNEAKIMQGVPGEIIERYGVYSLETASAMAQACTAAYRADIGIGVTGTFGNVDPANHDSIAGQVYYAICYEGRTLSWKAVLDKYASRLEYKLAMAGLVLEQLQILLSDSNKTPAIHVNSKCNGCGLCSAFCPKHCMDISQIPVRPLAHICDACGKCIPACPLRAIEKTD